MTEKDLRKLRRHDLLQLLLTQGREAAQLREELAQSQAECAELTAGNERLKAKLNEKDELIERLKGRLDQKDARIKELEEEEQAWLESRRIELSEAGSIAEAALKLNGVFEAAQRAADQYLYNIRLLSGRNESENAASEGKTGVTDSPVGTLETPLTDSLIGRLECPEGDAPEQEIVPEKEACLTASFFRGSVPTERAAPEQSAPKRVAPGEPVAAQDAPDEKTAPMGRRLRRESAAEEHEDE